MAQRVTFRQVEDSGASGVPNSFGVCSGQVSCPCAGRTTVHENVTQAAGLPPWRGRCNPADCATGLFSGQFPCQGAQSCMKMPLRLCFFASGYFQVSQRLGHSMQAACPVNFARCRAGDCQSRQRVTNPTCVDWRRVARPFGVSALVAYNFPRALCTCP